MKLSIMLSLLLVSIAIKANAQVIADTLQWRADYKLKWEDFQGKPQINSEYAAVSECAISYNYFEENNKFVFSTNTSFSKSESWVDLERVNSNTLRHEQTHFNINELFARDLLSLLKRRPFISTTIKEETQSLFDSITHACDSINKQYDFETNFSRNELIQDKWNFEILQQLDISKR